MAQQTRCIALTSLHHLQYIEQLKSSTRTQCLIGRSLEPVCAYESKWWGREPVAPMCSSDMLKFVISEGQDVEASLITKTMRQVLSADLNKIC